VLALLLNWASEHGAVRDPQLAVALSYLVVWIPLCGAVLSLCYVRGFRSIATDLGLRIRPLDLLWGLTLGVLARVGATVFEIVGYGRMGTAGATLGEPTRDLWWVFAVVLAPVLFSPLIEEVFFRGLLLRAVARTAAFNGAAPRGALAIALVVSAGTFALLHVSGTDSLTVAAVVGASTLLFGVGAGALAAITGRAGGAVVAHITFNALVVGPSLLG